MILYSITTLFAIVLHATPQKICVRNYVKEQNDYDPCANSTLYSRAIGEPGVNRTICTRVYPNFNCHLASAEYQEIASPDGHMFCTVDYNQPGISNLCESTPQLYDYVVGPPISSARDGD